MMEKTDFRGVVMLLPGFPENVQREAIAPYSPSEVYVIGRAGTTLEDVVKQQRPPKAVVVQHTALAARQKGGFLVEASSGLRSDRAKDWNIMRKEADQMLRRICQGSKSAGNARRGAVGYTYSDKHILIMLRLMESKRYTNDDMRIEAISRNGVKPVPKRTWLLTRLKPLARERGLLE